VGVIAAFINLGINLVVLIKMNKQKETN